MNITPTLKRRIDREAGIVSRYFPAMRWFHEDGALFCEGHVSTNARTRYRVRVDLRSDYPASLPELLVMYPAPLKDAWGKALTARGPCGNMHVLGASGAALSICHYRAECWSPNHTVYRVLMKGRVWLEAYERHIATGHDIDFYLAHQEPS